VRRVWTYLVGIFGPDPFLHGLAPDPGAGQWCGCGHAATSWVTDRTGTTRCPECWAYQQAAYRSPLWGPASRPRRFES
jgi:hypothetical protein